MVVPALIGVLATMGTLTLTPERVGEVFDILLPATAVAVLLISADSMALAKHNKNKLSIGLRSANPIVLRAIA